MKKNEGNEKIKLKLTSLLKNKYALIVLAIGLVLVLWPSSSNPESESLDLPSNELSVPGFSLRDEEERLEAQLSKIKGAGRVSVLLSVHGSASRELAGSGEETLILSSGGGEKVVELYYVNPRYMGAVIVSEGAYSAEVRLQITNAVRAFTGLGSDRITVLSMSEA